MTNTKRSRPKYQALLSTAERLFMKYGLRRVTVEEICREAGVSKMTFYKYFKNKHALVFTLVDMILQEGTRQTDAIFNQDIPFTEKIRQLVEFKLEYGRKFSKEFYMDWISLSPDLQRHIHQWSREAQVKFIQYLAQAQKEGSIRQDIGIGFVTYILNKMSEMAEDPALVQQYADTYSLTRDITKFFFYGIIGDTES